MNMDLTQLFRDYHKLTEDVDSIDGAVKILLEHFCIDTEEIGELYKVFFDLMCDKFELKKLSPKQAEQMDKVVELMLDSFFYGMFVEGKLS